MDKINPDWAKEVPCRNIIIYGFCKKKDEGCPFKHEEDEPKEEVKAKVSVPTPVPTQSSGHAAVSTNANTPVSGSVKSHTPKFNAKASASFTPMSKAADINSEVNSSGFLENSIPGSPVPMMKSSTPVTFMPPQMFTSSTPVPSPGSMMLPGGNNIVHMDSDNNNNGNNNNNNSNSNSNNIQPNIGAGVTATSMVMESSNIQQPQFQDRPSVLMRDSSLPMGMISTGMHPMMEPPNSKSMSAMNMSVQPPQSAGGIMQPMNGAPNVDLGMHMNFQYPAIYPPSHSILQYHLYAPDPPPQLESALKKNERTARMLFIPNDLREELVKRNLASLQLFPSGGSIPNIVQDYFGLVPLDFHQKSNTTKDRYQGHSNSLFKVFSNVDGKLYLLRRIHDLKINDPTIIVKTFQKWSQLDSANVVAVKDIFLTTAFGDSSICIVSDYYPNAISLHEKHFSNFSNVPLTEDLLWSYTIQLLNGLRVITNKRNQVDLDLDKVLVTGQGRVKITPGPEIDIFEEVEQSNSKNNALASLGNMLFKLACKMTNYHGDTAQGLPLVSEDFKTLVAALQECQGDSQLQISDIMHQYIGYERMCTTVLEAQQTLVEHTENILLRELENGRLFRLMCKLNFIFGRVENRLDINWSESGDKYAIVLFYDYVFHQVTPEGKPLTDLTHVLRCLNKLDAGVAENILLVTPDEMNSIIVSYKKLKELVDKTFRAMTL